MTDTKTSDVPQIDIKDEDEFAKNIQAVVNDTSSYNWVDDIPDEWK